MREENVASNTPASTMPSAATASSPAVRATALFTPDATPLFSVSTASKTVVVSGATKNAPPIPSSSAPGKYVVQYEPPIPGTANAANPAAATSAPTTSGTRAPMRAVSPPDQRDSVNISTTNGSRAERARREQLQRQHRRARSPFDDHERDEHRDACKNRADGSQIGHATLRADQPVRECTQPERREQRAGNVELLRHVLVATLRDAAHRDCDDGDRYRDVDEEHPAPRRVLREVAADHGPGRGDERREARPSADRPPALGAFEGRADERERLGHRACRADPLHAARRDEDLDVGRQHAAGRREREHDDPGEKHLLAPVEVAERSAQQDQRRQEQRVALDDPLHLRRVGGELALDHRQRDVDRAAVDERHGRAEDRRDQHPGLRHGGSIGYSGGLPLLPRRTA